jgi:serpin B
MLSGGMLKKNVLAILSFVSTVTIAQSPAETSKGVNQFSWELSKLLYQKDQNLFCSPLSVSQALAMTYAGAKGITAEEMKKALHYPGDSVHAGFSALNSIFKTINDSGKVKLTVANALWTKLVLAPEFSAKMKKFYKGEFYPLTNEIPINAWAEKKTNNLIKNLLNSGDITPDVKLVLTNAVYFKGNWKNPFDKESTSKQPFYLSNKTSAEVELMQNETYYKYHETNQYQYIELPYEGENVSMIVILPRKESSVNEVFEGLNTEQLLATHSKAYLKKVTLFLPKFKFETSYDLIPSLENLGIKSAFRGGNFSGITKDKEPLEISKVFQKAAIEVNEKGAEAAAVTVVMMRTTSAMHQEEPPRIFFRADRPFIFAIKENATGTILFTGVMEKP